MENLVYFQVLDVPKVELFCKEKGMQKPDFYTSTNNEIWGVCKFRTWSALYCACGYSVLGAFDMEISTSIDDEPKCKNFSDYFFRGLI